MLLLLILCYWYAVNPRFGDGGAVVTVVLNFCFMFKHFFRFALLCLANSNANQFKRNHLENGQYLPSSSSYKNGNIGIIIILLLFLLT